MTHLLKRIIRKILRIFGFVPGWEARQTRDQQLIESFLSSSLKKDALCVDIGAHKGDFIKILNKCLPQAKIIAFEPLPKFNELLKNEFPSVKLYDFALSESSGTSKFNYVVNDPGWSGFQKQSFGDMKFDVQEIEVKMETFDKVLADIERIDFIKIDVEGAEYLVLKGATNLIRKFKPTILFECAAIHMKNYTHTPKTLYELITQTLGLKIYSLQNTTAEIPIDAFLDLISKSELSNYNAIAQTNFIAK